MNDDQKQALHDWDRLTKEAQEQLVHELAAENERIQNPRQHYDDPDKYFAARDRLLGAMPDKLRQHLVVSWERGDQDPLVKAMFDLTLATQGNYLDFLEQLAIHALAGKATYQKQLMELHRTHPATRVMPPEISL